jgi:hypothetical protein
MPCTILEIRDRQKDSITTVQKPPTPLVLLLPHRKEKGYRTFWGSFHLSLGGDTALGVGDLDTESLGLGEDLDALAGRNGVGDPVSGLVYAFPFPNLQWTL